MGRNEEERGIVQTTVSTNRTLLWRDLSQDVHELYIRTALRELTSAYLGPKSEVLIFGPEWRFDKARHGFLMHIHRQRPPIERNE